jgi:hypothetical protein
MSITELVMPIYLLQSTSRNAGQIGQSRNFLLLLRLGLMD